MSKSALIVTAMLTLVVAIVFAVWPQLDLSAVHALRAESGFLGAGNAARMLRSIFYWLPAAVMALMILAWLAAQAGAGLPAACVPKGKSLIFLALGLAIGPGLLVNVGLKEHSARPRPAHVKEFGGTAEFRPWHTFDGACRSNCSFVSGEASASTWVVAAASLAPPPWKGFAVAAAWALAVATGLLRMAFGGHFLSDVLLAGLFTLLVCQMLHMALFRVKKLDGSGPQV